jgi:hypothetical protein
MTSVHFETPKFPIDDGSIWQTIAAVQVRENGLSLVFAARPDVMFHRDEFNRVRPISRQ